MMVPPVMNDSYEAEGYTDVSSQYSAQIVRQIY